MMDTLPDNILAEIVGYFEHEPYWKIQQRLGQYYAEIEDLERESADAVATLWSLCLTSKRLHQFSVSLLYRSFDRDGSFNDDTNKRTKLFLRTLLENQHLANRVEDLTLGGWGGTYSEEGDNRPPPPDLLKLYREDILPTGAGRFMLADLKDGQEDAEITLLVSLCRNVKTIDYVVEYDLNEDEGGRSYLLGLLRKQWAPESEIPYDWHILSQLTALSFQGSEEDGNTSLINVATFMRLPKLTHLHGARARIFSSLDLDNAITALTHIEMKSTSWGNDGIYYVLKCCPGLEFLSLEVGEASGDFDDESGFELDRLGKMLGTYTKQLTHLSIDTRGAMGYGDEEFPSFIGNLKPLQKLQTLRMPLQQLLDCEWNQESWEQVYGKLQDLLPESITDVVLLNYTGDYQGSDMPDELILHEPGKMRMWMG